jgi:uncharacterized membrane protein
MHDTTTDQKEKPKARAKLRATSVEVVRDAEKALAKFAPPPTRSLSKGLGWFSIGLGLGEIFAAGPLARLVGVPNRSSTRWILRCLGLRELGAGLGLLSQPKRAGWLWARATGDLMDMALLGSAMLSPETNRVRTSVAMSAVLGVTALDAWAGQKALDEDTGPVRRAVTIRKSAREIYDYWRDLSNVPRFMDGIEDVEDLDARRSRWRARGPGGAILSWDAEIVEDRAGESIQWRTRDDSALHHEGAVRFVPSADGKSTEVHVSIRYGRSKGAGAVVKAMIAPLSDVAIGAKLEADLGRLKQLLEIGHVMRSDASIHRGMHPARPADEQEGAS